MYKRYTADDTWSKFWGRIQTIREAIEVVTKRPTTGNRRHGANAGNDVQTSEDYYRINVYYPFISRVVV